MTDHTTVEPGKFMRIGARVAAISLPLVALVAAACSGGDAAETTTATTSPPTATVAAVAPTATATAAAAEPTAAATATATADAATTVSANNATIAELTAAFDAAGISNAARWAREVDEYRPYSTDDTNLDKLRGELAKYNPGAGVVDAIVATLSLP